MLLEIMGVKVHKLLRNFEKNSTFYLYYLWVKRGILLPAEGCSLSRSFLVHPRQDEMTSLHSCPVNTKRRNYRDLRTCQPKCYPTLLHNSAPISIHLPVLWMRTRSTFSCSIQASMGYLKAQRKNNP
jgi:hypothetical protein